MTNEEAIQRLKEGAPFSALWNEQWEEALSMGIEALQERKIGKWRLTETHNCYEVYQCDECKREITVFHSFCDMPTIAKVTEDYPYCHCGAKMEVE